MSATERLALAWAAETARRAGLPGAAERLERQLSDGMMSDYAWWAAREAERHIAEHHRRHRRFG